MAIARLSIIYHKEHMKHHVSLEQLFEQAVEAIPYNLTPTSITQGDFEADENGFVEYSEEFTFSAGRLFNEELVAGGWVDLRQDEGDVSISGLFAIARNGDWKDGLILPECTGLIGEYDLETKHWEFYIDQY
jgi:hypothetical protein